MLLQALRRTLIADIGNDTSFAVFQSYDTWWENGGGVDAWDTGPTTRSLLEQHRRQPSEKLSTKLLEERSRLLDQALHGRTAGVNAAHRVAPLALASCLSTMEDLAKSSYSESRLTHWSQISQYSCAVVALVCRLLISGLTWKEALQRVMEMEENVAPDCPIIIQSLRDGVGDRPLVSGGFCPNVLSAAVRFVSQASSFDDALNEAIRFAGPDNYCPVLVGAFAGALFGSSQISEKQVAHCKPDVCQRCVAAADSLHSLW